MIDASIFAMDRGIYEKYVVPMSSDETFTHIQGKHGSRFAAEVENLPIDFLNLYRLRAGAELLRETGDSIASIAVACGFGQQSYYNRLFLREYGMTPREYWGCDQL